MIKFPIYLDYMATTPVDPRVVAKMNTCLDKQGYFGNSASQNHRYGHDAAEQIQQAREQVAECIGADAREIIWTAGATEANNLAIKGAAQFYRRQGNHIITMASEHKAVLDVCDYLTTQGFEVTTLPAQSDGLLDIASLKEAVRPTTILLSIMHVNNETGVIQDIQKIGEVARMHGLLFHVDAAQSAGKIPINLKELPVDLLTFSAHKLYGPKGIGALYVRRQPRVRLTPLIHGGGHEQGLRSGTLPTHQIVGFGEACVIARESMSEEMKRITQYRDQICSAVSELGGIHLNGNEKQRIGNCLNIRIDGIEGETLITALYNIAISSGSACTSAEPKPSHVLTAMGLSTDDANRSIRISVGRMTTMEEISMAIDHLHEQINRLRAMSPIWKQVQDRLRP